MARPKKVVDDRGRAAMDQVAASVHALTRAETALHDAVGAARASGVSWQVIGSGVGMSRQAAQKRFSVPAPGRLV